MKYKIYRQIIEVLKNQKYADFNHLNLFEINTREELATRHESDLDIINELYGDDWKWCITYSDFPDYCFVDESDVKPAIENWLDELLKYKFDE